MDRRSAFDGALDAPRRGFDATSFLSLYVFLLIAIPSKLVVGPLGGAGTPAQLVGVSGALWWIWSRIQRPQRIDGGRQPVQIAMWLFVCAVLTSYVYAMVRPISVSEISTADLGLVSLIGWIGVVMVSADGITDLDRLWVLLRRVAAMGGALASLGIAQFLTKMPLIDLVQIPGLTANQALSGLADREGLARPAGTAVHPIEFGVVLTIILPIAITCAMTLQQRGVVRRWFPVAAIAVAIPLSISRTAILGTAICLLVLVPTWQKTARRWAVISIAFLVLGLLMFVPGIVQTITGLFTGIASDSSAASRTGSYAIAWEFIQRSPFVGRGFATFLPTYWILDNAYLGLLIETGFIGLLIMLGLLVSGMAAGRIARRRTSDPLIRQFGQALTAAIASGASSLALYDLLGFPMSAGILFLALGLAGALYRLSGRPVPGIAGPGFDASTVTSPKKA